MIVKVNGLVFALLLFTTQIPSFAFADSVSEYSNGDKADTSGQTQSDGFATHPIGYSLIGVGGAISFISFAALFAGGDTRSCKDEKNRTSGETEGDCRDRKKESNAKFYRTMGIGLGVGLATVGAGIAVIKFGSSDSRSASIRVKFEDIASPMFAINLPF